jgi:gas vesicle protein
MRKFFAFLAGLFLGLWAGGLAALLLAPFSGDVLQRRIREWVEQVIEEGRTAAESRRTELEEQFESFKQGKPITLQEAPQAPEAVEPA